LFPGSELRGKGADDFNVERQGGWQPRRANGEAWWMPFAKDSPRGMDGAFRLVIDLSRGVFSGKEHYGYQYKHIGAEQLPFARGILQHVG
jgi:hypothetical protein